jgi:hypothetical protein
MSGGIQRGHAAPHTGMRDGARGSTDPAGDAKGREGKIGAAAASAPSPIDRPPNPSPIFFGEISRRGVVGWFLSLPAILRIGPGDRQADLYAIGDVYALADLYRPIVVGLDFGRTPSVFFLPLKL